MRPAVLTSFFVLIYTICASSAYIKVRDPREDYAQSRLLTRGQASTAQFFDEPPAIIKRVEPSVVVPDADVESIETPKDAWLRAISGKGRKLGPNRWQLHDLYYKKVYKDVIIEKVSLGKRRTDETDERRENQMKLEGYIKQLKKAERYIGETRTGQSSLVYIASLPPLPGATALHNPLLSNQDIPEDPPSTPFVLTSASH